MLQSPDSGRKMIESLEIKNFRCFKNVSLNDLTRVNVIVGQSGTGKTAFLEALYLAAGTSPQMLFNARTWRGAGTTIQIRTERDSYESVWQHNFYGFNQDSIVEISFKDSQTGLERRLNISYGKAEAIPLPLSMNQISASGSIGPSTIRPISFEWQSDGKRHTSTVLLSSEGLKMPAFEDVYNMAFVNPGTLLQPTENALRFSELSKKKQQKEIVNAVAALFPQVEDLSLEIDLGTNMVFASIRALPVKLPLVYVSAGINKFLALLLFIASLPNGVLLVDEIENGLYFSKMPEVWRAIIDLCRRYETQLFVSTHSMECLQSMLPEVTRAPGDFTLLRLTQNDDATTVKRILGDGLAAALEGGVEIR